MGTLMGYKQVDSCEGSLEISITFFLYVYVRIICIDKLLYVNKILYISTLYISYMEHILLIVL